MDIDINTIKSEATNAVLDALTTMYENADTESMSSFSETGISDEALS